MQQIAIKCQTSLSLPIDKIHDFQGNLKTLSRKNFDKLKNEIVTTGFRFAPHVWQDPEDQKYYLIDGHQRLRVIRHLVEKEGYFLNNLPVVPIEAASLEDAKRAVLQATSEFGIMDNESLYEFMEVSGLPITMIDNFRLPDINLTEFKDSFGASNGEDNIPQMQSIQCPKCGEKIDL